MTKIIGIMSGTSTDGLDMVFCDIGQNSEGQYAYKILHTKEIPYSVEWKERLRGAMYLPDSVLLELDVQFAEFTAECAHDFIAESALQPDWIASHGHTVFHVPEKGITLQIGNGNIIANKTNVPTIYDFRSADVKLGGQGAPLVPIGDEYLFGEYVYCLNLGGFANISMRKQGKRIGYDVCLCNIILNHFSHALGIEYDAAGSMAKSGRIIDELLNRWNELSYYQQLPPKSLGREWVESNYLMTDYSSYLPVDLLRTSVEHIAIQIGGNTHEMGSMLITGGGAFNDFLIERISHYSVAKITIPDEQLVNYKEALIFALMGYLRVNEINNVMAEVTGATQNHCSGKIAYPQNF